MTASQEYLLRWRGRQSGPYTLKEINRLLDEHEIGMGHEIQSGNGWVRLEEFLGSLRSEAKNSAPGGLPPAAQLSAERAAERHKNPDSPVEMPGPKFPLKQTFPSTAPVSVKVEDSMPTEFPSARPRRRIVFALLAVLLGFAGVHNFYARNSLTGIVQLLVTCASYLLGFGVIVTWVWALVEAVLVHNDGYGLEMT